MMPVACICSACFHSLFIMQCAMLNLLAMTMMEPLLRQPSVAIISNMEITSNCRFFQILSVGVVNHPLKPVLQSSTRFFSPLFMVVAIKQMTIKHSIYMQKVPFLCTEWACVVFSSSGIRPRRKVVWSKVLQVLQTRGSTILHTIIKKFSTYYFVGVLFYVLYINCNVILIVLHTI